MRRLNSYEDIEFMKSWKTTVAAAIAALGVVFTKSDDHTLQTIGAILSPLGTLLIGMFARDNKVTSEQVGAK